VINPEDYGINKEEYEVLLKDIKREPNHVEMGIYSAMWSEHCSYKHTKSLLKKFPTQSDIVVQGPGENAGVVAVDKDWNLVFKIESHNHPSYVAPYDGAATGVGGLIRDVMAIGARPVGVKALLRFGDPSLSENDMLIREVRKGAAYYGAECDVASLGEELFIHSSFSTNPLVNVIVLGLAKSNALMQSSAGNAGNKFIYFGKPTGSDGVDGASFASQGIDEDTSAHPPSGDAALGKELMIASLLLIEAGLIEGLQDMGAAGLTSSSFEMANKACCGFEMNLDDIPKTGEQISGYELMLSETQERMLASVKPEYVEDVLELLGSFPDLCAVEVGKITEDIQASITYRGDTIAVLPVPSVVDGFIRYPIDGEKTLGKASRNLESLVCEADGKSNIEVKTQLQGKILNASELMFQVSEQEFGSCSGIDLPDLKKTILLRTLSNGAEIIQDPYRSTYQLVTQAYEDIVAQGAKPIALSDCLNSGDPDNPQTAYEIKEGLRGLADACRDLGVPVIGGNVSLYNTTNDKAILSQFIIGMVGILDNEE